VEPQPEATACLTGNCKKSRNHVNEQSNKATNIAQKAAQEAKAASEVQEIAGQQAAHQVSLILNNAYFLFIKILFSKTSFISKTVLKCSLNFLKMFCQFPKRLS
jgi:Protein of unknown function (DUF745).